MDIRLDGLELTNFKGLPSYALVADGQDITIRGDNATGKTTLADAFRWLLFGKDTRDRTDFEIKTLEHGEPIHNLDHVVEAMLLVDDAPLRLKKVFKEKWTKKRGQTRKEFTGHTTDHYIDNVPVQKKEWDARIGSIIDEETFKLLTSASYFNSLHWQKRREILLQVCGDVTDEDVIASDEALADLPEILADRSIEDHKKVVAGRRKEINKRLEEIPARIDELRKSVAEAPKNPKAIEAEIQHIEHKTQKARDDTESASLRKQKAEAEASLAELNGQRDKVQREATAEIEKKLQEARRDRDQLNQVEKQTLKRNIRIVKEEAAQNEHTMERLRVQYNEEAAREYEGKCTCPTCGQALPEDQVEAARAKHNDAKAQVLADINRKGKGLKERNGEIARALEKDEERLKEVRGELEILGAEIEKLEAEIELADTATPKLDKKINALREQIDALQTKIESRPATDTSALEKELQEAQDRLADFRAAEKAKVRVGELEAEEKALSAEFEDLEHQSFLMDQFVITKVGLLEDKVAEQFELVRFRMFEEQINGGIQETCVTTVDGVPYGSGLNNGSEINAGLDIIKTLSRHYVITAPVWIDNAEAVTSPLEIKSQTIKLVVDERHPEMEVGYGQKRAA